MKTLKRESVPACDICKAQNDVVFDVPTNQGPWANLCESCLSTHGGNISIGYKLIKVDRYSSNEDIRNLTPTKEQLEKEFADNFDLEDYETLMDSVAPTACPEGCEVEPDGQCCHGYKSIQQLLGII